MFKWFIRTAVSSESSIPLDMQISTRTLVAISQVVMESFTRVHCTLLYLLYICLVYIKIFQLTADICSHTRVHKLFIETLRPSSKYWAIKCSSYREIYYQVCKPSGEMALMGGDVNNMANAYGLYYVQTNNHPPFCLHCTWRKSLHLSTSSTSLCYEK